MKDEVEDERMKGRLGAGKIKFVLCVCANRIFIHKMKRQDGTCFLLLLYCFYFEGLSAVVSVLVLFVKLHKFDVLSVPLAESHRLDRPLSKQN